MYDPQVGRFLSEDPIGFSGGNANLYGYVGNNPQNWADPLGLYPNESYSSQNFIGSANYTFASMLWDGIQREQYHRSVSRIPTSDGSGPPLARYNAQDSTRGRMSPLGRGLTDRAQESRDLSRWFGNNPPHSPAKSNPTVDKLGKGFRRLGAAGLIISSTFSAYNIYSANACERGGVIAEELGGLVGGLTGGYAGAVFGAGVGTLIGGPIGTVVGAVVGGVVGGYIGDHYGRSAGREYYRALSGP